MCVQGLYVHVCVCVRACVYNTFYQETTTITAVITFGGFQLLSAPCEPATAKGLQTT